MQPRPLILLAEDDDNDAFFLRRALTKAGLSNPLVVACDGQTAIEYLNGDGPYADRELHPLPGLLLLDINMPRKSGFDVLSWLRARPDFGDLPAVVLSSSALESDIQKAKDLGADDYQVKPSDPGQLVTLIRQLHARWLTAQPDSPLKVPPLAIYRELS